MRRTRREWIPRDDVHLVRYVRAVTVAGVGSLLVYLPFLWGFRVDPLHSALPGNNLAGFYDLQARALMHGHLDLPRHSLGIEGFIRHGREYMYFPPGPALARIPILAVTDAFDGRLTAISMLLAWIASVLLFAALIWRVRRMLRGNAPLPSWEAVAYGLLIVAGSVGSVQLYLGAMPWVYHEAYAWSIAMALAATFTLLGVIQRPTGWRVVACSASVLGAVLCRAPTGWAFGMGTIATAVWFLSGRHSRHGKRFGRMLLLAGAGPLLIGIGINWAKFEHPYLFPLEDQVWTSVNEHRREALDANGGDLVSFDLLPSTLVNYFRPDGIRVIPVPPFITFPNTPAHEYGGGFLDQTYRTGSAIPFMPALVLLGLWGLVLVFRPGGPTHASHLRIPVLSAGAISGAMLIFGYISYRYLSEVLPVLLLASAIGLVDLGHLLSLRSADQRSWFLRGLAALTTFGVLANGAVAFTTQSLSNPGPMLNRYLGVQESISDVLPGDPLIGMVGQGDRLPAKAAGERLFIVHDCAALYVSQAETYWPWVPAEIRPLRFDITYAPTGPIDRTSIRTVELAHPVGQSGALTVDVRGDGAFRLAFESDTFEERSVWFPMGGFDVSVVVDPDLPGNGYLIHADGQAIIGAPISENDDNWFHFQNLLVASTRGPEATRAGVIIREVEEPTPPRCGRLLAKLDR